MPFTNKLKQTNDVVIDATHWLIKKTTNVGTDVA